MRLETLVVEKVWGRHDLPAPFAAPGSEPVGEIWFKPVPALEEVLVKYLFTSEKLSVQVHPSDAQAPNGCRGKEECWLVLDAEPGATLAIGFKSPIDRDQLHSAALDGTIEDLLEWHPASAGDFFYLPAGTVHAIGPGLTLVEVQQNSDITYRLFDYGRPRELHLEDGARVAQTSAYDRKWHRRVDPGCDAVLVDGPHFRLSQCIGDRDGETLDFHRGPVQILPLEGSVTVSGERVAAGQSALAESVGAVDFGENGRSLLVSAP